MDTLASPPHNPGMHRRRFLAKAVVAGGAVWAVPVLVSSGPASAASLASPPPTTTTLATSPVTGSGPPDEAPAAIDSPGTGAGPGTVAAPPAERENLAETGM